MKKKTWAELAQEIHLWHDSAVAALPPSRSVSSQLVILETFRDLALKAHKMTLRDSYRELSEASGLSLKTLWTQLPKLADWIEREDMGSTKRSKWHLKACSNQVTDCSNFVRPWTKVNIPLEVDRTEDREDQRNEEEKIQQNFRSPISNRDCSNEVHASEDERRHEKRHHDLWRGNKTGRRIFNVLRPYEGQTEEEVHEAIQPPVHPRTTKRWLTRLAEEGLAECRDRQWFRLFKMPAEQDESFDPDFHWHGLRQIRHEGDRILFRSKVRDQDTFEQMVDDIEIEAKIKTIDVTDLL